MKEVSNSKSQEGEAHKGPNEKGESLTLKEAEGLSQEELNLKRAMIDWRRKGNKQLAEACAEALKQSKEAQETDAEINPEKEQDRIKPQILEELQQKINRIEAESEESLTTMNVIEIKPLGKKKELDANCEINPIKNIEKRVGFRSNKDKISVVLETITSKGFNNIINELKIINQEERRLIRRSLLLLFSIELIYFLGKIF